MLFKKKLQHTSCYIAWLHNSLFGPAALCPTPMSVSGAHICWQVAVVFLEPFVTFGFKLQINTAAADPFYFKPPQTQTSWLAVEAIAKPIYDIRCHWSVSDRRTLYSNITTSRYIKNFSSSSKSGITSHHLVVISQKDQQWEQEKSLSCHNNW